MLGIRGTLKNRNPFLFLLAFLPLVTVLLFVNPALARSVVPPVNPVPSDGETDVQTEVILYWDLETVVGGVQSYDVYFGTDPDPPYFGDVGDIEYAASGDLFMDVGELEEGETYYWRVVAHYYGDTVSGPTWSFETEEEEGSSSGCSVSALNPLFLLFLAPLGLLMKKSR